MTIKIDHDVPLPPAARRRARYPFATMKAGDSFAVPCGDEEVDTVVERVRSSAAYYRRSRKDVTFIVRAVEEGDPPKTLVRCWMREAE